MARRENRSGAGVRTCKRPAKMKKTTLAGRTSKEKAIAQTRQFNELELGGHCEVQAEGLPPSAASQIAGKGGVVRIPPNSTVVARHQRKVRMVPKVETLRILVPTRAVGRLMTDQIHRVTVCGSGRCRKDWRHWRIVFWIGIDSNGPVVGRGSLGGRRRCGLVGGM